MKEPLDQRVARRVKEIRDGQLARKRSRVVNDDDRAVGARNRARDAVQSASK